VVATKVGSLSEIVEDGKTGFLVPPEDPSAIADAVIKFFQHNCAYEFRKNILIHKDRFSWVNMVDIISRLLHGM
jgi:glycosyltransferase involved in cell wall biosynthesis